MVRHVEYFLIPDRTGAPNDVRPGFPQRAPAGNVAIEDIMKSAVE
jgi:hypothetical protein